MDGKRRYTCPALLVMNESDYLARRSYFFEEDKFTIEPPSVPSDLNLPLVSCQFEKMAEDNKWVVTIHGNTKLSVNNVKVESEIPFVIRDNDEILLPEVAHFRFVHSYTPYAEQCSAKKLKSEISIDQNTELNIPHHSQPSTSSSYVDDKPFQSTSSASCVVSSSDLFDKLPEVKVDEDSGKHSLSDISDDSNSDCQFSDVKPCLANVTNDESNNSDDCVIVDVTPGIFKKTNKRKVNSSSDDCQIVDVKLPLKPKRTSKKDAFGPYLADDTNRETDKVNDSSKCYDEKTELVYDAAWKEARLQYLETGWERLEFKLRGYQLLNQSLTDERVELLKRLQDMEKSMLDNVQLVNRIKTLEEDRRCKDELGRTISNLLDDNLSLKTEITNVTSIASMLEKENSSLKQKNEETERKLQEQSDAINCLNQDENGEPNCPTAKKMKTKVTELMENEFRCSICEELFIEPIVTSCNHVFCSYCLQEWRKKKNECPFCRTVLTREFKVTMLDDYIANLSKLMSDKLYVERIQTVKERKKSVVAPPPRLARHGRRLQLRTPEQLNAILANPREHRDFGTITTDPFASFGAYREVDPNPWPFIPAAHTSTSTATSLGYSLMNLSHNSQSRGVSLPTRSVAPMISLDNHDITLDQLLQRRVVASTSTSASTDATNFSQRNRTNTPYLSSFRSQATSSVMSPLT